MWEIMLSNDIRLLIWYEYNLNSIVKIFHLKIQLCSMCAIVDTNIRRFFNLHLIDNYYS